LEQHAQFGETRVTSDRATNGFPYAKHGGARGIKDLAGPVPSLGRLPNLRRQAAQFGETARPVTGDGLHSLKRQAAQFGATQPVRQTAKLHGFSGACQTRQFARQDLHLVIDKINKHQILMVSSFSI
jgi:hypothetical protein